MRKLGFSFPILKGLTLRKIYGLYFQGSDVFVSEAKLTLGGVAIRQTTLDEVFRSIKSSKVKSKRGASLFSFLGKKKKDRMVSEAPADSQDPNQANEKAQDKPIAVLAIQAESVFYSSVPVEKEPGRKLELSTIITQNPRIGFLDSTDFILDWYASRLKGKDFVFMGAIKAELVRECLQKVEQLGFRLFRTEPAPLAALRTSYRYCSPLGNDGMEIRCMLGRQSVLICLMAGSTPLTWRFLDITDVSFQETLESGIRAEIYYAKRHLNFQSIERLVFLGFKEKNIDELTKGLVERFGCALKTYEEHGYDFENIITGLAIGSLKNDDMGINLSKTIQPPIPLKHLYPILETFLTLILLAAVLIHMDMKLVRLRNIHDAILAESMVSGWSIGWDKGKLASEKRKLEGQTKPVGDFLCSSAQWTQYLVLLPDLIPMNAFIPRIYINDPLVGGGKKSARSMAINVVETFPPAEGAPRTVEETMDLFTHSSLLKKGFPIIVMSGVGREKGQSSDAAKFSVICREK